MLSGLSALGNLFYGGPSASKFEETAEAETDRARLAIENQARAAREQAANQTQSLFAQSAGGSSPLAARQAAIAGASASAQTAGNAAQQRLGFSNQLRGEARQDAQAARARSADAFSGLIGAGASGASMLLSDERAKTAVRDAGQLVDSFLSDLSPRSYEYREDMGPGGRRAGVMAQDIEQNPIGRQMVSERPDGMRQIDVPQAASAALAGLGRLRQRLEDIEMSIGEDRR